MQFKADFEKLLKTVKQFITKKLRRLCFYFIGKYSKNHSIGSVNITKDSKAMEINYQ